MKKTIKEKIPFLPQQESNCENCCWFLEGRSCLAFTEIPDKIWNGKHNEVLKEQKGDFVFKSIGPLL